MKKVPLYLGFIMAFLYLAVGVLFIFTNVLMDMLPRNREWAGLAFLLYGSFRVIMCIQKLKRKDEPEQE